MAILSQVGNRLVWHQDFSELWIEPWGDGLRVRMTRNAAMNGEDWALLSVDAPKATITIDGKTASIDIGSIKACINEENWLCFYNAKGELLLEEYWRNRNNLMRYCVPLGIGARELKPITGTSDFRLIARFEARKEERIYGMGQYQDGLLDKKGATLELAHRNSQASIPFMVSSLGYGFLWNNPAVGKVTFGSNVTEWEATSTDQMDYWVTAGDTPRDIVRSYAHVTGTAPMMPEYGMGFWQCKLRYRTQEELLGVAREHKRRGLPMDVIVVDFFHWPMQGEWRFDPIHWPDPAAMVKELQEMGIELMVSIWPTVDSRTDNYSEMAEKGYLIGVDRGARINMNWMGETVFYDATNPGARQYVWDKAKENYFDKGIKIFWLDEAEPEYGGYDFDIYRYHMGPARKVSNIYPNMFAKGFYDGMRTQGIKNPLNLVRCGWAGAQRYGSLLWSGDVYSSFRSLREQVAAGLSTAMAGVPWWTSDIGGFIGGDPTKPEFRELLIRWFEFGAFCPVFRLHGERYPFKALEKEYLDGGIRQFSSGQDNEVWSYGEDNFEIMKRYLLLRERLRPYVRSLMKAAHEQGDPVMRPMMYEFPCDPACNQLADQYMFGPDLLVAPVLELGAVQREVYLPCGATWTCAQTDKVYTGGQTLLVDAPLSVIPLFLRDGAQLPINE